MLSIILRRGFLIRNVITDHIKDSTRINVFPTLVFFFSDDNSVPLIIALNRWSREPVHLATCYSQVRRFLSILNDVCASTYKSFSWTLLLLSCADCCILTIQHFVASLNWYKFTWSFVETAAKHFHNSTRSSILSIKISTLRCNSYGRYLSRKSI